MEIRQKVKRLGPSGITALLVITGPAFADAWFYGHRAPTVSAAVAFKDWHDCIAVAAVRLDDHASSVMDIASAIEPLCITKEDTMIDAINKEFLDKNPGIAANMGLTEMDRTRQEAHTSFRQRIGTLILVLRRGRQ